MKRDDWEVFLESFSYKNRTMKMSVVENLCVALTKVGCRQRWWQAFLSLNPFSWIKSEHSWYICGLFNDVRMLPVAAALSESIAYFISGDGDVVASLVNTFCQKPVPTQA